MSVQQLAEFAAYIDHREGVESSNYRLGWWCGNLMHSLGFQQMPRRDHDTIVSFEKHYELARRELEAS